MVCVRFAGGRLSQPIEALFDHAWQIYTEGNLSEAASLYHDILGLSPHHPDALHMLGVIAQRANKPQLALALFEDALAERPVFPRVQYNRSLVLRLLGRDSEAIQAARMAVDADPDLAEAWDIIGQITKDQGNYSEASACFGRALLLQPQNPHFHGNHALLQVAQGDMHGALASARRAEALDPAYPPMLLGNILQALGYPELAADCFARTRILRPSFKDAAAIEAMARLQMGDLEQGWALMEKRPDLGADTELALKNITLWQGQKVDHLLLYEDQGLGDALQFARYIPLLQGLTRRTTLRVRAPLVELFHDNFPHVELLPPGETLPQADARCRLSSLPFFFSTRVETIPSFPYIAASVKKRSTWRQHVRSCSGPRIGLVWAGNVRFRQDAERSIGFEKLEPLIDCGASHFVSLQKDRPTDEPSLRTQGVYDAAPLIQNFADTAALIAELDLLITVDTAVAHLAGALGKPFFMLLPFASDWRWLLGRNDSPWYKSAKLYRQRKAGAWEDVIERVAHDVNVFIGGNRDILRPSGPVAENVRQNPEALPLPL